MSSVEIFSFNGMISIHKNKNQLSPLKTPSEAFFFIGCLFIFESEKSLSETLLRAYTGTIDVTYAQSQPRTVESGLRPHLSKTGLRPEPGLEQLEGAEQIDSFGYLGCGVYLESLVRERTLKNIDQVICSRNTFKYFV